MRVRGQGQAKGSGLGLGPNPDSNPDPNLDLGLWLLAAAPRGAPDSASTPTGFPAAWQGWRLGSDASHQHEVHRLDIAFAQVGQGVRELLPADESLGVGLDDLVATEHALRRRP